MPEVTEPQVLNVLRSVLDPDLNRDIVSLGFVKNVKICGGAVGFDIELTTPACPVKEKMQADAREIVGAIAGVIGLCGWNLAGLSSPTTVSRWLSQ